MKKRKEKKTKMEPFWVVLLISLTVCATSSSHPLESTQSPNDIGKNAILSNSAADGKVPPVPIKTLPEEIRLNITLETNDKEKEIVDVDQGKIVICNLFMATNKKTYFIAANPLSIVRVRRRKKEFYLPKIKEMPQNSVR